MRKDSKRLTAALCGALAGGGIYLTVPAPWEALGSLVLLLSGVYAAQVAVAMDWDHLKQYGRWRYSVPGSATLILWSAVHDPRPALAPYVAQLPDPAVQLTLAIGYGVGWTGIALLAGGVIKAARSEFGDGESGGGPTAEDLEDLEDIDEDGEGDSRWELLSLS